MTEDVAAEIMEGTYRALCERGYAEVTMQDIADRTEKSKAALHYHYGSKRGLLLAFLEYLFEEFTDRVDDPPGETAADRLESFVDAAVSPPETDPERRRAFQTALLELKAQAPYDEEIRERLRWFDDYLFEQVRPLVVAGIERGEFRDVDPDDAARFVVTALAGAHTRQVAVGQDDDCARRMLRSYVRTHLVADGHDRGEVPAE